MNAYLNFSALAITALLALGVSIDNPAHAELLVHEPFAYPNGTVAGNGVLLNGQGGAEKGFAAGSKWSAFTTGVLGPANPSATAYQEGTLSGVVRIALDYGGGGNAFDGTVDNLPTSGGYFGSATTPEGSDQNTTDHMLAWRTLDPAVAATFTDGSTTWFSYVAARAWGRNGRAPSFAIGADRLTQERGNTALGEAIGAGGANRNNSVGSNSIAIFPQFFDQVLASPGEEGGNFNIRHSAGDSSVSVPFADYLYFHALPTATNPAEENAFFAVPNIVVGKITWRDGAVPDEISVARFLETDTLNEANFDAVVAAQPMLSSVNWLPARQPVLDQSKFDTVSFGGGRYFADELRIATTFSEVIGEVAGPAFRLAITRNAPNLDFTWNSQPGKLYRLWSSPNLSSPAPTGWTMVQQDLPANPATLQIAQPANLKLFYVLEEYPAPPMVVFSENFDANVIGWTTGVDGGFATDWEVGTPSLVGPPAAYSGTNCYATNIDSDYGFNADIWLRTPAIDLTAYTTGTLEFFEFKDIENVLGDSDFGRIRILAADDNAPLAIIESGVEGASPTWESYSKVLPVAAFNEPIKIEFQFKSDDYDDTATGPFAGWYIDNVVIRAGGS